MPKFKVVNPDAPEEIDFYQDIPLVDPDTGADQLDSDGNILIDKNSAVGILEEFKANHKDAKVTATFFVNGGIFNQSEYNEKILNWMIDNGYDDYKIISVVDVDPRYEEIHELNDHVIKFLFCCLFLILMQM